MTRNDTRLRRDAKTIAAIVETTNSDHRGDLFKLIADELRKDLKYFTAILFERIAKMYGVSEGW